MPLTASVRLSGAKRAALSLPVLAPAPPGTKNTTEEAAETRGKPIQTPARSAVRLH